MKFATLASARAANFAAAFVCGLKSQRHGCRFELWPFWHCVCYNNKIHNDVLRTANGNAFLHAERPILCCLAELLRRCGFAALCGSVGVL